MRTMARIEWVLKALIDEMDKLTDWEQKFVINTETYLKKHTDLTDTHYEKLEEIYERVQAR